MTTTPLSERLATALVELEDAATNAGTVDAILSLCASARAWTRVADEVDEVVDPQVAILTAQFKAARGNTLADRAALSDAVALYDSERRHRQEADAERDRVIEAARDKVAAVTARAEAAERRLAELTKPGPATDAELAAIATAAFAAAGQPAYERAKAAHPTGPLQGAIDAETIGASNRAVYALGLAHGRAEQAARVADEADGDPERTALRATIAALQARTDDLRARLATPDPAAFVATAIGEIERDAQAERLAAFESCDRARRAAEAEVARLAVVAREACDLAESFADDAREYGPVPPRIAALRASIPTTDPAAFVAAVDRYGAAEYDIGLYAANPQRHREAVESRAALLALGGVK